MKTRDGSIRKDQGSVLLITLLICVVLGILVGSYLGMLNNQHFSVMRAGAWNRAIVVAEAGVEEAMTHLNATNTTLGYNRNGWAALDATTFKKTGVFESNPHGNAVYYDVTIITTNREHPMIVSTGYVAGPIGTEALSRVVQVKTKPNWASVPEGAMVVVTSADLKGTISTDSYQSTNTTLFPGGRYNTANALDHGDIHTISKLTNAITVQNAQIKGKVHTAPGGKVSIQNGAVGDKPWVEGGNQGIQTSPPHELHDAMQTFQNATLPDTGGAAWIPAQPGPYLVNGVSYKYLLSNSKPWKIVDLDGSVYVSGNDVKLWVSGSVNLSGTMEIRIPANKKLSMYVMAPSATISGQGVVNETGVPKSFQYYGLPSNTALTLSGNGEFVGQIYCPQADFTLGGGGSAPLDFSGLSVTKSARMNGNFKFHYDESSAQELMLFGYSAMSWDELFAQK